MSRRDKPRGTPSILAGAPPRARRDGSVTEQLESEMAQQHEDSTLDRDGEVRPERPVKSSRTEDTPDQTGIEIDNAIERPQEGQPGQPGAKP